MIISESTIGTLCVFSIEWNWYIRWNMQYIFPGNRALFFILQLLDKHAGAQIVSLCSFEDPRSGFPFEMQLLSTSLSCFSCTKSNIKLLIPCLALLGKHTVWNLVFFTLYIASVKKRKKQAVCCFSGVKIEIVPEHLNSLCSEWLKEYLINACNINLMPILPWSNVLWFHAEVCALRHSCNYE